MYNFVSILILCFVQLPRLRCMLNTISMTFFLTDLLSISKPIFLRKAKWFYVISSISSFLLSRMPEPTRYKTSNSQPPHDGFPSSRMYVAAPVAQAPQCTPDTSPPNGGLPPHRGHAPPTYVPQGGKFPNMTLFDGNDPIRRLR